MAHRPERKWKLCLHRQLNYGMVLGALEFRGLFKKVNQSPSEPNPEKLGRLGFRGLFGRAMVFPSFPPLMILLNLAHPTIENIVPVNVPNVGRALNDGWMGMARVFVTIAFN